MPQMMMKRDGFRHRSAHHYNNMLATWQQWRRSVSIGFLGSSTPNPHGLLVQLDESKRLTESKEFHGYN